MCKSSTLLSSLSRVALATVIVLNLMLALPALAWAQGETPRCPDAPFRIPSGNWTLNAYNYGFNGGTHSGVDFVDQTKAYTTTQAMPFPEMKLPPPRPLADDDEAYWRALGIEYPENVTPVYSPIDGYMDNIGRLYPIAGVVDDGFPGSVLITGTLDAAWASKVPTTTVRLWFTHMSNYEGTVSYVIRPSGPIQEGDLIGFQGKGSTFPTHLHVGIYSSYAPYTGTYLAAEGVQDPTTYFNAAVSMFYNPPNNGRSYPITCYETPVGAVEYPYWGSFIKSSTTISGYALDPANITTTLGIDQVRLFRDGYDPALGGSGVFLGMVNVNQPRPDIYAKYGGQSLTSGWSYTWNLTGVSAGRHGIYLYAHQTSSGKWLLMDVRFVTVTTFFRSLLPSILR